MAKISFNFELDDVAINMLIWKAASNNNVANHEVTQEMFDQELSDLVMTGLNRGTLDADVDKRIAELKKNVEDKALD
ncbi:hypothetical protein ACRHK7_01180 [Weissella tructae]|uniref:hypothetical protein n=1 Tax=Weissella tructae TaxID=887702 RepID=UPI003D948C62